ncbi:MFS transporter [Candidatus Microgenomates bacterium]|nr:MFS transporter [Candidatus Microgenomates bacterium]
MSKRPLFFLYLTVFINMVGFGMVFPLLPFYAQAFNATPLQIGLLAASFSIVQFFTSPILGRISDKVGRKPVLIWGLLGGTISMGIMGLAQSLPLLFLARALHGAVSAAVLPAGRAYIADVTSPKDRVAGMGRVGASFALGFLFGPAFGSFLVGFGGIHIPFFVAAIISALNAFSVTLFLPESLREKAEKIVIKEGLFNVFTIFKHLKSEPGILFAVLFAWSFGLSNNQVAFPLLMGEKFHLGAAQIGYFFTAIALVSSSVQGYFLPKIVRILGEKKTIFVGMSIMGGALLLLPFAPKVLLVTVSFMFMGLGSALNRPTAEGVISRISETGQGTTLGVANSFESLGRVAGPLLGGVLYGVAHFLPFFVSASILWLLAFLTLWSLRIPRTS